MLFLFFILLICLLFDYFFLADNPTNCSNLVSSKLFNFSSIEALHKAIVVSDIDALKQNVHLNPHVMVIDNRPLTQPVLTLAENVSQLLITRVT